MSVSSPRAAVASALEEEIEALKGRLTGGRQETWDGRNVTVGRLGPTQVVLTHTGTGMTRARTGVSSLLDRASVEVLLYVGVAGALSPSLEVEALLAPTAVQHEDERRAPAPNARWHERAVATSEARPSTLVTVDRVVTRPDEKAALWSALDHSVPAAVDMETFAVAQVAAERNVPYLPLRVISDAADDRLPDLLRDAQREDGGIDRGYVMRNVMWSPSAVPTLMRMQRRVQAASDILADAVASVIRSAGKA